MPSPAVMIRVKPELLQRIDKQATLERRTRSNLILLAVEQYLDSQKEKTKRAK